MCKRLDKYEVKTILFEDNQTAIRQAKSEESNSLKLILKLSFYYVKSEAQRQNLDLIWIGTKDQLANTLTKHLPLGDFTGAPGSEFIRIK